MGRNSFTMLACLCCCQCIRSFGEGQCCAIVSPRFLQISLILSSWGQDGGSLASVCADPSVDVVALAFLTDFFGTGGLPVVNFGSSCSGPTFSGTDLLQCSQIGYASHLNLIFTRFVEKIFRPVRIAEKSSC